MSKPDCHRTNSQQTQSRSCQTLWVNRQWEIEWNLPIPHQVMEGWQNGNASASKADGRKPLEVRILYPPHFIYPNPKIGIWIKWGTFWLKSEPTSMNIRTRTEPPLLSCLGNGGEVQNSVSPAQRRDQGRNPRGLRLLQFFAANYKLTLVNLSHKSSIESNSMSGSANSAKKVVFVPRFSASENGLPLAII